MTRKLDQADLKDIEDIRETLADSHRVEIFADDAKLLLDAYDCVCAERDSLKLVSDNVLDVTLEPTGRWTLYHHPSQILANHPTVDGAVKQLLGRMYDGLLAGLESIGEISALLDLERDDLQKALKEVETITAERDAEAKANGHALDKIGELLTERDALKERFSTVFKNYCTWKKRSKEWADQYAALAAEHDALKKSK